MMSKFLRLAAAVVAVFSLSAAPALAASSSSTSTESLNVLASVTLTGVPATITYSDSAAGATVVGPTLSLAVSTNNGTGFAATVAASDLTGPSTLSKAQRRFNCTMSSGGTFFSGAACVGSDVAYAGSSMGLGSTNAAGSATWSFIPKIVIPNTQAAGAYSGTLTFTATTNP